MNASSNLKYNNSNSTANNNSNSNNNNNNTSNNNNNNVNSGQTVPAPTTTTTTGTTTSSSKGVTSATSTKQNAKISSKFSASQPFLPAYDSHNHHHHLGSKPSQADSNGFIDQAANKHSSSAKIDTSSNDNNTLLNSVSSSKQLLAQCTWSDRVFTLKEIIDAQHPKLHQSFAESDALKLPLLAKVVKGSYGVIKEKSATSLLSKSSVHNLCLYQKCKFVNVLCQSIRYKDKKSMLYGNKISIPLTYGGWFEILSEDGKSVKPLYSIKEVLLHSANATHVKKVLASKQQAPAQPIYLVRENVTAYMITMNKTNNSASDSSNKNEIKYLNANLNDCKKVIVKTGDKLRVLGEIVIDYSYDQGGQSFSKMEKKMVKCTLERNKKSNSSSSSTKKGNSSTLNSSTLNSANDEGITEVVYFFEDTKGKFSPIARLENISGVHRLEDIVKKFRFPITVQLVYGRAPSPSFPASASTTNTCSVSGQVSSSPFNSASLSTSKTCTNTNNAVLAAATSSNASNNFSLSNQFSPTLRLLKVYEVENILAYPIGKEPCLIQIPAYSNLSMVLATNMPDVLSYSNYLNLVLAECEKLAPEYLNMINYLPHTPPPSVIGEGNLNQPDSSISPVKGNSHQQHYQQQTCFNYLIGRAVLTNNSHHHHNHHHHHSQQQQQHSSSIRIQQQQQQQQQHHHNNQHHLNNNSSNFYLKSRTTQAAMYAATTTATKQYEESGGCIDGGIDGDNNNGITVNGLYEADFAIENIVVDNNDEDEADDEDRAFKEIDDLYEYVRSGILPEYLKAQVNVNTAAAVVTSSGANNTDTVTTAMMSSRSKITANNANNNNNNKMTNSGHQDVNVTTQQQQALQEQHHYHHSAQQQQQQQVSHHHHHHQQQQQQQQHQPYHVTTQNITNIHNNNHHHHQQQQQQHPTHSQHIGSSVTAVTPIVCTGTGGGGNDENKDHSELFDVSTTTNTRKTFKMSQKNSENVSGNSSYRQKKGKDTPEIYASNQNFHISNSAHTNSNMNTINSHVGVNADNHQHQQQRSKHHHHHHQQQQQQQPQQQQQQDISMNAEIVDREYMTFNNAKLIEDLAAIQLATPHHHYNLPQQQQQQPHHHHSSHHQPQQQQQQQSNYLYHHESPTINKNSFESVESIEKNMVYSSHPITNTAHYTVGGKHQEASTPISIPSQQHQKRNSLSKTQIIIDPATKLLHLPPIPYIKQQSSQQIKSSSNQLHQVHHHNHHHQQQPHPPSNNNSSSIVNINTTGLASSVNNNDVAANVLKLNADYSNKSLNYIIQQQHNNREQQTDLSFSGGGGGDKRQQKNNLISYAVQNDMYYKTIATQTHNIGLIDTANMASFADLISTTHTTHIANGAPPTAITGAQANYIPSPSSGTPVVAIADKKTYYSSIQDLNNFYYLNDDAVDISGGVVEAVDHATNAAVAAGVLTTSGDDLGQLIIDEYKYGLSGSGGVGLATSHVANSGVNNGSRFEMCNSVSQVTSQLLNGPTTASSITNTTSGVTPTPMSMSIPATTTSSPLAVNKHHHHHQQQQQQQQAHKDDLYSHNQFNYHHANIITHKLPNIEYFNYMEAAPANIAAGVNGMSVSSSGMGVVGPSAAVGGGLTTIDLTRECTFVRNNDRISTKMPTTKISNFNF